jgi:hypothetical protein
MAQVTAAAIRQFAEKSMNGSGDAWSSTVDCGFCMHRVIYWCADGSERPGYEKARQMVTLHIVTEHGQKIVEMVEAA